MDPKPNLSKGASAIEEAGGPENFRDTRIVHSNPDETRRKAFVNDPSYHLSQDKELKRQIKLLAVRQDPNIFKGFYDQRQAIHAAEGFDKLFNATPHKPKLLTKEEIAIYIDDEMMERQEEINRDPLQPRAAFVGLNPTSSSTPVTDLKETRIADLMVPQTHKGFYLPCRIASNATRDIAVEFLVEDPDGNLAGVVAYRYPATLNAITEAVRLAFPLGRKLALREPKYVYKAGTQTPYIRVESPSDIVFLEDLQHPPVNYPDYSHWKPLPSGMTISLFKEMGHLYFKHKLWFFAALAFSEGLALDPSNHVLILNRAEMYLQMRWYPSALSEAQRALDMGGLDAALHLKAVGRAARACYGLERYDDAVEYTKQIPDNPMLGDIRKKCAQRKREQERGEYDWVALFNGSLQRDFQPDIANYQGPVERRKSALLEGQHGMFATRDIKAGELLLVSKPIASHFELDDSLDQQIIVMNLNTKNTEVIERYTLICKVIERLWHDADLIQRFSLMYTGTNLEASTAGSQSSDGPSLKSLDKPIPHPRIPAADIDVQKVEAAVCLNSHNFTSVTDKFDFPNVSKLRRKNQEDTSSALYETPSFFNHRCIKSAHRIFFGDAIVIRAGTDIKAGEEIFDSYFGNFENEDPNVDATSTPNIWGITCQCSLCLARRADGPKVRAERLRLQKVISERKCSSPKEAESIIKKIEASYGNYGAHSLWDGIPHKLQLSIALRFKAVIIDEQRRDLSQAQKRKIVTNGLVKSMEADGLFIRFRADAKGGKSWETSERVKIEIKYGMPTSILAHIFSSLHIVGQCMATEAPLARLWMEAALKLFSIFIGGGKELFKKCYKKLLRDADVRLIDTM